MGSQRHGTLFRNGHNQAVCLPVEFEMPGDGAIMRGEGNRLVIEQVRRKDDLIEWLKSLEPLDEEFSDFDDGAVVEGVRPRTEPPHMLDTNILSDARQNPFARTTQLIEHFEESAICASAIAASEMHDGASKKGSFRLIDRIERTLAWMNVLPDDGKASRAYGIIRSENERQGKPICCGDLLITAHTRSLGLTLVTNGREFSRLDGLKIEHFLQEEAG